MYSYFYSFVKDVDWWCGGKWRRMYEEEHKKYLELKYFTEKLIGSNTELISQIKQL